MQQRPQLAIQEFRIEKPTTGSAMDPQINRSRSATCNIFQYRILFKLIHPITSLIDMSFFTTSINIFHSLNLKKLMLSH